MAGAGFKTFNTGDVLTASDVNTYLMQQTVMVFDDAAARTTALTGVVAEGMMSYLKDTNKTYRYDGSAWLDDAGTTSPLTTKGDVWGYSTTDARIPVGANGTVLTADSAEALGVKWAAAGTTFVGCRVTKSANQALVTATSTAITWDVEDYDTNTMHDTSTNTSRITIPSGQGGYYLVQANLVYYDPNSSFSIAIYKNGAVLKRQYSGTTNTNDQDIEITAVLSLAAGDYVEIYGRQTSGGNKNVMSNANDPQNSAFQVVKLG